MPTIAETSHFEGNESCTVMMLLKNSLLDMDEELAMVLEMAGAEALKPTSFADMQQHPGEQQRRSTCQVWEK